MPEDRAANPGYRYPWRIFWLLLLAALIGAACAYPYILGVFGKTLRASGKISSSLPVFFAIQILQVSLFWGLAIGFGLLLARKIDLRMPYLRAWLYHEPAPRQAGFWRASIIAGVVVGAIAVVVLDFYVLPRVPAFPSETALPFWQRALAAVYAGIDEELLVRLFAFSFLIWLTQISLRRSVRSSDSLFWVVNCIVAIVLTLFYLLGAKSLVPLTLEVVIAIACVNGLGSLIFGYLCWHRGLESAMLAHFICDFVMHSAGPFFAAR